MWKKAATATDFMDESVCLLPSSELPHWSERELMKSRDEEETERKKEKVVGVQGVKTKKDLKRKLYHSYNLQFRHSLPLEMGVGGVGG